MSPGPPPPTARLALRQVGSLAVVGAAISGVYLATGWGIPCPFRWATGWLCPFCGGTTAGAALLTGDLARAWQANPLLIVMSVLVAVRALGWVWELIAEPRQQLGRRWTPWPVARHWGWILSAVGLAYVLARNLG